MLTKDRIKEISFVLPANIENWLKTNKLKHDKYFITEVKRCVFIYANSMHWYKESRKIKCNYKDELNKFLKSIERFNENYQQYRNPLYSWDDNKEVEIREKLHDVYLYYLKMSIDVNEKHIETLEKKMIKERVIDGLKKTPDGQRRYEGMPEEDKKEFLESLLFVDKIKEELEGEDNKYKSWKTKRKVQIRDNLALCLASLYCDITSKNTVKAKHFHKNKISFDDLLDMCFKAVGEILTDDTRKKLKAKLP